MQKLSNIPSTRFKSGLTSQSDFREYSVTVTGVTLLKPGLTKISWVTIALRSKLFFPSSLHSKFCLRKMINDNIVNSHYTEFHSDHCPSTTSPYNFETLN